MQLLKQPQAIFGMPAPDKEALQAFEKYVMDLANSVPNGIWDQNLLEILELLPQVYLFIPDHIEVPPESFNILLKHPYIVFQSYKRDANPQLEGLLRLCPEYTYHLLNLFKSSNYYSPCSTETELKESMMRDPNWALRWCFENKDNSEYYSNIIQYVHRNKDIDAYCSLAHHRLQMEKMPRGEAIADLTRRLPLLIADPQIVLWIAENYPEIEKKQLFMRGISGKPSYMLYWAQKFPGTYDQIIQREFLRFPAWLPDYFRICKPENARELYLKALERCNNDLLAPWVDQYGKIMRWY